MIVYVYIYVCVYFIIYIYICLCVCVSFGQDIHHFYQQCVSGSLIFCQQGYLRTELSGVVRSLQIVHSGKVFTISKTIPGGSQFWMFFFGREKCNNMQYTVHRALPGAQSRRKRNSMRDFQSPSPA